MEEPKFDKTAFEVVNGFSNASDSDKEYWKSKTPEKRLQAAELLRRQVHGENYADQG